MISRQQDQPSRILWELSDLVFNLLRSPPTPLSFSDRTPIVPIPPSSLPPLPRRSPSISQITPAGFVALLLGISVSMMLCGSVTFFIGLMLMPWVLGLITFFYVAGILSTLSAVGRWILCFASAFATPRKDIPEWKLL